MKKILSFALMLVLCTMLVLPVLAAEGTFVPSITDKRAPEIVPNEDGSIGIIREENNEIIDCVWEECLLLTPVSQVNESTEISDEAKALLLFVYEELSNGNMQLPAEKLAEGLEPDELVVRDLFDVSWLCDEHKEMVAPEKVVLEVTFRVSVAADETIYVLTYKNNEWNPVANVVNNGDGTVTCTFESLCPVAFVVGEDKDAPAPVEPDASNTGLWIAILAAAAVTLIVVLVLYKKKKDEQK